VFPEANPDHDLRPALAGDSGELALLEPGWRALAESAGNAFLTPEWFRAWFAVYGEGARPAVVSVRDGRGELAGLLPLVLQDRSLRFGGANLGDRFGLLARPGLDGPVAAAAAQALAVLRGEWTTLVLDNVDAGREWVNEFLWAWPGRLATSRLRHAVLPYTSLQATDWDGYLAARSRNFRNQVRRKTRALEREHGARFRRTERQEELEEDLAAFFALHDARWDLKGGSSSKTPLARAFHGRFAAAALQRGWLRLWFLEIEGTPVAAWYGWRLGRAYSYYLAGFDPAWSEASAGFVLLAHTVREAFREGAATYEMLLGDEPYKSRFADRERLVESLVGTRPLHPMRIAVSAEAGARRIGERLPDGARDGARRAAGAILDRLPSSRAR
jgi:CelD/BcsL family acetyltransferase involved in cellulose biosynthesis